MQKCKEKLSSTATVLEPVLSAEQLGVEYCWKGSYSYYDFLKTNKQVFWFESVSNFHL